MKIRTLPIAAAVVLLCQAWAAAQTPSKRTGLIKHEPGAFVGYTLFAPQNGRSTYLVDMEGRVVHRWRGESAPGESVYLLDNGHLLRCECKRQQEPWHGGGIGGVIREFDWDSNVVWEYDYGDERHCQHHDIEPLPSGNVLIVAWERKTRDEAIQAGREPELVSEMGIWPDHIIEVKPQGDSGGTIVWEWHVWDHLVQSFDKAKDNYGSVVEHPELVDINYVGVEPREGPDVGRRLRALGYLSGPDHGGPHEQRPDWNHTNAIDHDPVNDQIILSVLEFHEIWVIDHSTTTEEAASHKGGRWGRGGDLLYRCGNPLAHGVGRFEDQTLFAQHDAQSIERGLPGAGNVLVFNNGRGRIYPGKEFSTVEELALPFDRKSGYRRADTFGFVPCKVEWKYGDGKAQRFFSGHISGAQRLPNGNTLICSGEEGRVFEVTSKGDTVWEYVNPFGDQIRRGRRPPRMGPQDHGARPGDGSEDGPRRGDDGAGGRRDRRPLMGPGGPGGRGFRPPHPPGHGGPDQNNALFRATRIAPDHPGLKGRKLEPIAVEPATTQKSEEQSFAE